MKRIIMQAGLMAVGVLVLAIGAHAQQQYRAAIPFDFEAAGKQNAAGKYTVGPASLSSEGAIVIRSLESGKTRMLGFNNLGGTHKWDKPGTLTFRKVNGRYHLSAISTATFGMKIKRTRAAFRELAGASAPHEEVITIYLN